MPKKLILGSDCCGIEAIIFALKKAKIPFIHKFSCDSDKNVKKSVLANFKPEIFYDNIFGRDIKNMPYVDLYVCGFPCQPFSLAGKKLGLNDKKNGNIFYECIKYIKAHEPKIFILENVKGLLTNDNGKTIEVIKKTLSSLKDYTVDYMLLNSMDYGLPQNRERIFIVGIRKSISKKALEMPKKHKLKLFMDDIIDKCSDYPKPDRYKLTTRENKIVTRLRNYYGDIDININNTPVIIDVGASDKFVSHRVNMSPTLKATRSDYYISNLKRKLSICEALSLQGFPKSFKVVVSDTAIYKQIGNSISVNVLYYLLKEILSSVKHTHLF